MTKTKPMKPAKAWALVEKSTGLLICYDDDRHGDCIYATQRKARKEQSSGERIAHVEIREVAYAPKGH